jgi:hypothetical protein
MRSNAARDWEDKTVVNARPAERFSADPGPPQDGPRALPTLFDEEEDDEEATRAALTRVHSMPSALLRASKGDGGTPAHLSPSEALIPLVVLGDAAVEDANASDVSRSGIREHPRRELFVAVRAPAVQRPRAMEVAVAVLITLAAICALLVTR